MLSLSAEKFESEKNTDRCSLCNEKFPYDINRNYKEVKNHFHFNEKIKWFFCGCVYGGVNLRPFSYLKKY